MKRYIKYSVILLLIFICCSCSKNSAVKMIRKDYIKENNGVFFKDYALAIDEETNDSKKYAVFKLNNSNTYKKQFNVVSYSKNDTLLACDNYLYIFYKDGGFTGYNLSSSNDNIKKVEPDFASIDGLIYYPKDVLGCDKGYLYLSYYSDSSNNNLLFAKVKENLSSYSSVKSLDEIPKNLINYIQK